MPCSNCCFLTFLYCLCGAPGRREFPEVFSHCSHSQEWQSSFLLPWHWAPILRQVFEAIRDHKDLWDRSLLSGSDSIFSFCPDNSPEIQRVKINADLWFKILIPTAEEVSPLVHVWMGVQAVLLLDFQFRSVAQSCLILCDPMDCRTPGFPVHHQLLELAQTHVHQVGDAIQPSHPLSSPSRPAFNLSQHQGLFQWVSSLHQVAKVLEFQLQHQSFQWIFRTDFL